MFSCSQVLQCKKLFDYVFRDSRQVNQQFFSEKVLLQVEFQIKMEKCTKYFGLQSSFFQVSVSVGKKHAHEVAEQWNAKKSALKGKEEFYCLVAKLIDYQIPHGKKPQNLKPIIKTAATFQDLTTVGFEQE